MGKIVFNKQTGLPDTPGTGSAIAYVDVNGALKVRDDDGTIHTWAQTDVANVWTAPNTFQGDVNIEGDDINNPALRITGAVGQVVPVVSAESNDGSKGVDLMANGSAQMRAGSIAVSAGTTETFDIPVGAGYQGVLVMAAWHGDSGTGMGTAVWMVGGFMNTSANTRITAITNVSTSGGAMTLVWQASGVLRFSLANTSGGQAKQARVSWIKIA